MDALPKRLSSQPGAPTTVAECGTLASTPRLRRGRARQVIPHRRLGQCSAMTPDELDGVGGEHAVPLGDFRSAREARNRRAWNTCGMSRLTRRSTSIAAGASVVVALALAGYLILSRTGRTAPTAEDAATHLSQRLRAAGNQRPISCVESVSLQDSFTGAISFDCITDDNALIQYHVTIPRGASGSPEWSTMTVAPTDGSVQRHLTNEWRRAGISYTASCMGATSAQDSADHVAGFDCSANDANQTRYHVAVTTKANGQIEWLSMKVKKGWPPLESHAVHG